MTISNGEQANSVRTKLNNMESNIVTQNNKINSLELSTNYNNILRNRTGEVYYEDTPFKTINLNYALNGTGESYTVTIYNGTIDLSGGIFLKGKVNARRVAGSSSPGFNLTLTVDDNTIKGGSAKAPSIQGNLNEEFKKWGNVSIKLVFDSSAFTKGNNFIIDNIEIYKQKLYE